MKKNLIQKYFKWRLCNYSVGLLGKSRKKYSFDFTRWCKKTIYFFLYHHNNSINILNLSVASNFLKYPEFLEIRKLTWVFNEIQLFLFYFYRSQYLLSNILFGAFKKTDWIWAIGHPKTDLSGLFTGFSELRSMISSQKDFPQPNAHSSRISLISWCFFGLHFNIHHLIYSSSTFSFCFSWYGYWNSKNLIWRSNISKSIRYGINSKSCWWFWYAVYRI